MDDQRLDSKLDKITEHIGNIDVTLAKQHVTLEEHMKRSAANEQAVAILASELKPVLIHVSIMRFIGKILLAVLASGIVVETIKWLFVR